MSSRQQDQLSSASASTFFQALPTINILLVGNPKHKSAVVEQRAGMGFAEQSCDGRKMKIWNLSSCNEPNERILNRFDAVIFLPSTKEEFDLFYALSKDSKKTMFWMNVGVEEGQHAAIQEALSRTQADRFYHIPLSTNLDEACSTILEYMTTEQAVEALKDAGLTIAKALTSAGS